MVGRIFEFGLIRMLREPASSKKLTIAREEAERKKYS